MKLTRLVMHGFRSYLEPAEVRFEPGANVFLGRNEAGKTSILLAVQAALYAPRSAAEREALVAEGSAVCQVGLEYELPDGRRFRVDRDLVGHKGSIAECRDGTWVPLASSVGDIAQVVREHTGCDEALFRATLLVRHEGIEIGEADDLTRSLTERIEVLVSGSPGGVSAARAVKKLETRVQELGGPRAGLVVAAETRLREARSLLASATSSVKRLADGRPRLEELTARAETLETELADATAVLERARRVAGLEKRQADLRTARTAIDRALDARAELATLESEAAAARAKVPAAAEAPTPRSRVPQLAVAALLVVGGIAAAFLGQLFLGAALTILGVAAAVVPSPFMGRVRVGPTAPAQPDPERQAREAERRRDIAEGAARSLDPRPEAELTADRSRLGRDLEELEGLLAEAAIHRLEPAELARLEIRAQQLPAQRQAAIEARIRCEVELESLENAAASIAELEDEAEVASREVERLRFRLAAMRLAREELQASIQDIRLGVGPELAAEATRILAAVADEYSVVLAEGSGLGFIPATAAGQPLGHRQLSDGTIDQFHFAVRVALADVLLGELRPAVAARRPLPLRRRRSPPVAAFDALGHRRRAAGPLLHRRGACRPRGHPPPPGPCEPGGIRMTLRATRLSPGPSAETWLSAAVAEHKGADPLSPLTVVVPNNYAGLALRRRIAAGGYANVRFGVLTRLAELAGASDLAAQNRVPLTAVTEEAAIRSALRAAGGLGAQTEHRAVVSTLHALFKDLAEGGLDGEAAGGLAARGELARVAISAHDEYRRLLDKRGFYDRADLFRAAAAAIDREGATVLADWGAIIVYLPTRLSVPELELLNALGRAGTVEAGLTWLDDAAADAEPQRWATALGLYWEGLPIVGTPRPPDPEVLIAPDVGEEVRASVRRVLADLETSQIPLHRTALVYRHQEPYQQLVRETLDAAKLPWVGLGGKPISESFAGRGLLGLLHLQGQRFSRGAVLNWLSSLPHGGDGPSLTQWDRISRKAGIVRGVEQWSDRLQRKLEEDRGKIEKLEKEDDESTEPLRNFLRSEAGATEEMRRRIEEMDRRTRPPRSHDWAELAKWALELRGLYIRVGKGWTTEQEESALLVDETIGALAAAAPLDTEVEVDRFVETLEQSLVARRRPEGKLGKGVVTGSISSIAGMTFDRVYVLGMTERAYPAPAPIDPIFPVDAGEDPLGRAERRLAGERMSYLGALAAGGQAVLCFPTHDTEQRPAYPARWLLDAVSTLLGHRVGPSELRELRSSPERPWLTSFVSTEAALRHGPVMLNLPERRVNEAREIAQGDGDLLHSAMAARGAAPSAAG